MANKGIRDIKHLYKAKKGFHQELSNLPFERKIEILLKLQQIALPIMKKRGICKRIWKM